MPKIITTLVHRVVGVPHRVLGVLHTLVHRVVGVPHRVLGVGYYTPWCKEDTERCEN